MIELEPNTGVKCYLNPAHISEVGLDEQGLLVITLFGGRLRYFKNRHRSVQMGNILTDSDFQFVIKEVDYSNRRRG